MPSYDVAHIREQGVDLIIVPLDRQFDHQTDEQREAVIHQLQTRAHSAGLRGTVVPVWQTSSGSMAFIAPRPWHPFFRGVDLGWVGANINRQLYW